MPHPVARPLAVFAALGLALPAAAETYTVDARHTFPSFEISHLGFSIQRGRFDKTEGTIALDPAKKAGSIRIAIAADSIDTGLPELEEHLKKAEFLNVAQFPTIRYEADQLAFEGDKPVRADGTLTLLGVSRPVSLAIDHFQCGVHPITRKNVCGANATTRIKRSEFGMKTLLPAVGDEVEIAIQVEGFRD
jgi:polyisoprenoid-binding protein YceI